jgi:hypothetical protein
MGSPFRWRLLSFHHDIPPLGRIFEVYPITRITAIFFLLQLPYKQNGHWPPKGTSDDARLFHVRDWNAFTENHLAELAALLTLHQHFVMSIAQALFAP